MASEARLSAAEASWANAAPGLNARAAADINKKLRNMVSSVSWNFGVGNPYSIPDSRPFGREARRAATWEQRGWRQAMKSGKIRKISVKDRAVTIAAAIDP